MSDAGVRRVAVDAADAYCRTLLRHYENFTVASRLSPRRLRRDLARVYAFCRTTDDLGDETGDAALAVQRLSRWREDVIAIFGSNTPPEHPVLVALADTVRRHALPAQPFLDLIEANLQDQTVHAYDDWPALHAYCMRSAAPVGRIVLRLNGFDDSARDELSDSVCIGLQLANFAQDVSVDAAKGRCYLLQEELRALGQEGAVRALCERARALLDRGRELEATVPPRLRVQLAMYRLGGVAIIDAITGVGYRTVVTRPMVTKRAALGVAAAAVVSGAVSRAPSDARGRRHAAWWPARSARGRAPSGEHAP